MEGMSKEQVVMIQETVAEVLQLSPHLSRKTYRKLNTPRVLLSAAVCRDITDVC